MGRNMFGPVRGPWGDEDWKGWWGDEPPYHHPVFVLTHHAHDPIPMEGGTTFHFVTDGLEAGLRAGARRRRWQGRPRRRRRLDDPAAPPARLIDEMHVAISPVFLGSGERLFDTAYDGYEVSEMAAGDRVFHVVLAKARRARPPPARRRRGTSPARPASAPAPGRRRAGPRRPYRTAPTSPAGRTGSTGSCTRRSGTSSAGPRSPPIGNASHGDVGASSRSKRS